MELVQLFHDKKVVKPSYTHTYNKVRTQLALKKILIFTYTDTLSLTNNLDCYRFVVQRVQDHQAQIIRAVV